MVYWGKRKYRKRKQIRKGFPIGFLASAAAPILGEVAKPILKKISAVEKEEEDKRKKIVLRRRAVPVVVNLPNHTSFESRYERISRKKLPGNISVSRAKTIGPRNKQKRKKKVRFPLVNSRTEDRARRIKKI